MGILWTYEHSNKSFLNINLVTLHRGLNTPNGHLLKLQQVFMGGNPAISAPELHHPMVANNEKSSTSLHWAFGVVELPQGPAKFRNFSQWYQMPLWPSAVIILGHEIWATFLKNNSTLENSWGLLQALKVTLTIILGSTHTTVETSIVVMTGLMNNLQFY